MPERWVVDASPIISLAKVNKASLMMELCEELLIPSAVAEEINRGPGNDPAKLWLQEYGIAYVKDVGPVEPIISAWDLGRGETEVINWANANSGWIPVLDDRAARNCTSSLGIRTFGTIGIIVLAKKHQKIEAVVPLLKRLEHVGFRINQNLFDTAVELAGEKIN